MEVDNFCYFDFLVICLVFFYSYLVDFKEIVYDFFYENYCIEKFFKSVDGIVGGYVIICFVMYEF